MNLNVSFKNRLLIPIQISKCQNILCHDSFCPAISYNSSYNLVLLNVTKRRRRYISVKFHLSVDLSRLINLAPVVLQYLVKDSKLGIHKR